MTKANAVASGGTMNKLIALLLVLVGACGDGRMSPQGGTITGVTVTSPACASGSFVSALTGGAIGGVAPVGGTCVPEVGDISGVSVGMGIAGGGTAGTVTVGLLSTCADGQVLKSGATGTTWTCANDTGGEILTAGAGLTKTGTTMDLVASSSFVVAADLLGLSTAVAAPGSLTVATTLDVTGNSTFGPLVTVGGDLTVGANTTLATLGLGTIRPAAITGTVNDWAPTGLNTAVVIRIAATGTTTITGITGGSDGRILELINESAEQITFAHEFGSVLGNRFTMTSGNNQVMIGGRRDSIRFIYDGPSARWTEMDHTTMDRLYVTNDTTVNGLAVGGAATLSSTLAVTGAATFAGNTTLGDAVTDIATIQGALQIEVNSGKITTKLGQNVTSLSAGCGTGASLVGDRTMWTLTTGTTATDCTITFTTAFANVPTCVVSTQHATKTYTYTPAAASITIGTVQSSAKYDGFCGDHH